MSVNDNDPLNLIGEVVEGKYRIESLAGAGGFSAVYRAEHLLWKEPVAIKFFTALGDTSDDVREQLLTDFVQEGKLMTQLSSRSAAIVQARDIGKYVRDESTWYLYMVLEWLEGEPLDRTLSRERKSGMAPRQLNEAVSLLDPVAEALNVAHKQNVAHRDLKPANVVCLGDPREMGVGVKVLDFGIAKIMGEHEELQEQLKQTGQQITSFTPHYGAPEQFSRTYGATGPWTDVFAMALILVEMVRGSRALGGSTVFDLGASSCHQTDRPTPRLYGVETSDAVESVFQRAVSLRVESRYPHMAAFWHDLHAAMGVASPSWVSGQASSNQADVGKDATQMALSGAAPLPGAGSAQGATINAIAQTIAAPSSAGRNPVFAAVAVVGVLALSGGAYLAMSGNDDTGAAAPSSVSAEVQVKTADAEDEAKAASDASASPTPAESAVVEGDQTAAAPSASSKKKKTVAAKKKPARRTKRRKPKAAPPAKPKPPPKTGGDAWDPNSFGGR